MRTTEKHIVTIRVDKLLSNSTMYEHRCLGKIKNLYKTAGKCDYQPQYKDVLEAAMVSNNERFTDNSPMTPNQYKPNKSQT